jgi:hypothetical protein
VGDRWKELHQKDNQPLFLTISAGQGNELQFVGKKPDGSTWISGAVSICSFAGNNYQVKLDRIDKAPLLVGLKLRGMSDTIPAGSSHLKFGADRVRTQLSGIKTIFSKDWNRGSHVCFAKSLRNGRV